MTRWIGPAGVEREGMGVESVWPMIIALVLNVFNGAGVEREGMGVESVWPRIIALVLNVFNGAWCLVTEHKTTVQKPKTQVLAGWKTNNVLLGSFN